MYRNKFITIPVLLGFIFFMVSCATRIAPRKWLPTAKEALRDTYGGWIVVVSEDSHGNMVKSAGEFIAYQEGTAYILTGTGPIVVPADEVISVSLAVYRNDTGKIILWTVGGTLSTISHGYYLIFTAPAWVLAGSIAGIIESKGGVVVINEEYFSWDKTKKFARFPQGLPDGIDLSELNPKPVK